MSLSSVFLVSKVIQRNVLSIDCRGMCKFIPNLTSASIYQKINDNRLQELKGRDVEFSTSRARERLAQSPHNLDCELRVDTPYDCHGVVNLCSVMQSTVPTPYNSNGKSISHLNMPGGMQRLYDKYVYSTRHQIRTYSTSILQQKYSNEHLVDFSSPQGIQGSDCERFKIWSENCLKSNLTNCEEQLQGIQSGRKSLQQIFEEQEALIKKISLTFGVNKTVVQLTQRERLKRAIKEYGGTVVVFHVTISLISLGSCYLAVSSGIDFAALMTSLGVGEAFIQSQLATGASTFVIAYAVHKLLAPVRIAITLSATPLIVRHLRKIGFLKPPQRK